jgi:hypothetical protein
MTCPECEQYAIVMPDNSVVARFDNMPMAVKFLLDLQKSFGTKLAGTKVVNIDTEEVVFSLESRNEAN